MASPSVTPSRSASCSISGLKMPAQAEDDVSVAGKREPSSSPKASTSMPNGSALPRAKMLGRQNAGDHAERAVVFAGIDHRVDVRADQQALAARPSRPRTVPSASSRDLKPRLAHPVGDAIGGAAVLGRQKQPHQPVRLGRNRAERVDHRFGARAERIDVVLGEEAGSCAAAYQAALSRASAVSGRAISRSFFASSKPCMPTRHCSAIDRALDRLDQQQRERQASAAATAPRESSRPAGRPSRHAGSAAPPDGRR